MINNMNSNNSSISSILVVLKQQQQQYISTSFTTQRKFPIDLPGTCPVLQSVLTLFCILVNSQVSSRTSTLARVTYPIICWDAVLFILEEQILRRQFVIVFITVSVVNSSLWGNSIDG